jgi:hypothetical protein
MSPIAQNLKTGPEAIDTAENEFGGENMQTGPDALATVENESVLYVAGFIFGGTEGIGSHFHVSRFQTHFRRC